MKQDIQGFLAELEDIPGTRVFTAARARKGYWLNQFCMTLMNAENRARFGADEHACLDEWPMSKPQKAAELARDYSATIDDGRQYLFFRQAVFHQRD